MYLVDSGPLRATAAAPLDSYMLFLDEKQNKSGYRTSNKAQVTFDRNIKAVCWGDSSTGNKKVNTMTVGGSGSYGTGSQRGLEKKSGASNPYVTSSSGTTEGDWFHVDGKTIYAGAKNKYPGDFLRIIVEGATSNTAPVAADSSETVTENTYGKYVTGSYKNVASASTDADGDTLTVTHLKYDKWTDKNSNGIVDAGEIDPETSNV